MKKRIFINVVFVLVLIIIVLSLLSCAGGKEEADVVADSEDTSGTPVMTGKLEYGDLIERINLGCTLRGWREMQLVSEAGGRVVEVNVKPGDRIEEGDLLLKIDDEIPLCALEEAKAGLAEAHAREALAASELDRQAKLFEGANTSEARLEAAESDYRMTVAARDFASTGVKRAERLLRETEVRSPFRGVVAGAVPEVYMYLPPGQPLMTVIMDDPIKAIAGVSEKEVTRITPGQEVDLTVNAYQDAVFGGSVSSVGSKSAPGSGVFQVEIKVDNSEALLKSGMSGTVSIGWRVHERVGMVPDNAIKYINREPHIWSVESSRARATEVSVLGSELGKTAIEGSLTASTEIIVIGNEFLVEGDSVVVVKREAE